MDYGEYQAMTALSDLIARLEAVKRGNQKLGDKVLLACGWKTAPNFDRNNPQPYWIRPDGQNVATNRPDPTTSLDAALTLVPEGWDRWQVEKLGKNTNFWGHVGRWEPLVSVSGSGKTGPLALCTAALKAREAAR